MIRSLLATVSLVLVGACFQSHDGQQAVRTDDCVLCHRAQYDQAGTTAPYLTAPTHDPFYPPSSCVYCHNTTSWGDALHPQPAAFPDTFIIDSGPHAAFACTECHASLPYLVPTATRGSNTNCTQCHPDDTDQQQTHRAGTVSPTGVPYEYSTTKKNFCLTCHPTGLMPHPEDKFSITNDNHRGIACDRCHSESGPNKAGQNTNCVQCHPSREFDEEHREDCHEAYVAAKTNPTLPITPLNFCVQCHTSGTTDENCSQ